MSCLAILLIVKIVVTALLVAAPFLFAPLTKLEAVTGSSAKSPLFFRLYGVAITALLVGYAFGIPIAERGEFPCGAVVMGLVSNAGAALLLLRFSIARSSGFWIGTFFAFMALSLAMALVMPMRALEKLW